MKKVIIHSPIWATRSVGIAKYLINSDVEVVIDYKRKDGSRLYPDTYIFRYKNLWKYPVQNRWGVELIIIPIADLEVKSEVVQARL